MKMRCQAIAQGRWGKKKWVGEKQGKREIKTEDAEKESRGDGEGE